MAKVFADRVNETTTTTGTGTLSLDGAATGFQGFVAGIGTTNECYYCVTDDTDWEVGEGTVTDATPDTLSRDTILESSNSDAAVNWGAGTKNVFVVYPAEKAVSLAYTQTLTNKTIAFASNTLTGVQAQDAILDDIAAVTVTKGDILVANATDYVDLTVGANDTVLTADSAEATGVKWAAAGGGGASDIDGLSDAITNDSGKTVGLGTGALANDDGANLNTALGYNALNTNTSGYYNVAVGYSALTANTTALGNTAVGYQTLTANTTGPDNVAVGFDALKANTTGYSNVALGRNALSTNITGRKCVAVGYDALKANTGNDNTGFGNRAMFANVGGASNIGCGASALESNTTGSSNTAIGKDALKANTTADANVGIGVEALTLTTTGDGGNTAIGSYALTNTTTGGKNSSVGFNSMLGNTDGVNNSALGADALKGNTTGDNNVAVGHSAGDLTTTGSNNTSLGYQSDPSAADASNEVTLGNSSVTKFRIPGINFVIKDTTATDNYVLTVDSAGEAGWEAAGGGGGGSMTFLQRVVASSDATIDLTTGISSSTYDGYYIIFNVSPSSDARQLKFRTSADGGSTFDSGATDYNWFLGLIDVGPTNSASRDVSNSSINLTGTNDVGAGTDERIYGNMMIVAPGLAERTTITGQAFYVDQNGNSTMVYGFAGQRLAAEAVDGFQFYWSAGDTLDGTITMYGLKNS